MPGNAKNPGNPYAPAVDALSEFNLLVILEYIEHRGGPARLASLSIGKIPGLLAVIYYIDHERGLANRAGDVFDFFHLDRTAVQTWVSQEQDTQELIYILDDSENSAGGLPGYVREQSPAAEPSPAATFALPAISTAMQFATAADSAAATGQLPADPDEDEASAAGPVNSAASAWSLLPAFFGCGIWDGPQGLLSIFMGSETNPFSM